MASCKSSYCNTETTEDYHTNDKSIIADGMATQLNSVTLPTKEDTFSEKDKY